ncbi:MAG TPA: peptide chain release factor N(5)-glutamine methyltransferase [Chloroflexota bacterium]|jgi:release factor glutamine methyltransferase|nr:peptide chain release factor N(5)-glutamine methyltransferase [Chloroflexota bacterium]
MPRTAPMTVGTMLRAATAWLRGQGDEEARLDVELLLARALGTDRAGLYAQLGEELAATARKEFEGLLARHANGEPIAYILGEREFYGLSFVVRPGVLIPRPETELVVDQVVEYSRAHPGEPLGIVDVGTGCGAVAVAVAKTLPRVHVLALDVAPEAVMVASQNAARHRVADRVEVALGDLLAGVTGEWDVVVGNLPYIPSEIVDRLDRGVRDWEPRLALDGGPSGLTLHARLLDQLPARLRPGGLLVLEVADDRGEAALELFRRKLPGAEVELLRDMFGRDRAVRVIMPSMEVSS